MKTIKEIKNELNRLKLIIQTAEGIDREDCPELSTKIEALEWVLEMKNEVGGAIKLDIMIL